jgi:hypothetical protein
LKISSRNGDDRTFVAIGLAAYRGRITDKAGAALRA